MGFGIALAIVFPKQVLSQTTDNESIKEPKIEYIEATPEVVAQSEVLYQAKKANLGFCSCVTFVKRITGVQESVGAARNWKINSTFPQVGGVVVTKESSYGHVAYIEAIDGNIMTLVEANYIPCKKSERKMAIDDPRIKGFWVNN